MPTLFSFTTREGFCIECFFSDNHLYLLVTLSKYFIFFLSFPFPLPSPLLLLSSLPPLFSFPSLPLFLSSPSFLSPLSPLPFSPLSPLPLTFSLYPSTLPSLLSLIVSPPTASFVP